MMPRYEDRSSSGDNGIGAFGKGRKQGDRKTEGPGDVRQVFMGAYALPTKQYRYAAMPMCARLDPSNPRLRRTGIRSARASGGARSVIAPGRQRPEIGSLL